MALTDLQLEIVLHLRRKMGDNPTYLITSDLIGSEVSINLKTVTVTQAEVGLDADKVEDFLWTNEEYAEEIDSALTLLWKGKKTLEDLTKFEKELLIVKTQQSLVNILAVDSTRFLKYNSRDLNVEPTSPSELLELSRSLGVYIKELINSEVNSAGDVVDAEVTISQGAIQIYDEESGKIIPSNINPVKKKLSFTLTNTAGGVLVKIFYGFIVGYVQHYIIREDSNGVRNVLKTFTVLEDSEYTDTDVTEGETYTYEVHVLDVNNNDSFTSLGITYAAP